MLYKLPQSSTLGSTDNIANLSARRVLLSREQKWIPARSREQSFDTCEVDEEV